MEAVDIALFVYVGILFSGLPIGIIIGIIQNIKRKKKQAENGEECIEEEPVAEPETCFYEARVIAKRVHTQYQGVRYVKSYFWYLITFETAGGVQMEFPVTQEQFETFEKGQSGTLVTVNGAFCDFGDGEETCGEETYEETCAEKIADITEDNE